MPLSGGSDVREDLSGRRAAAHPPPPCARSSGLGEAWASVAPTRSGPTRYACSRLYR
jgi:hypothetical protein